MSDYPTSLYQFIGYATSFYAGSFSPKNNVLLTIVEHPLNIKPTERIESLIEICKKLCEDAKLSYDLEYKVENNIHRVSSKNICDYIKDVDIDSLFVDLHTDQKLHYLAGAYAQHRREEGEWLFYNNYEKVILIHGFLVGMADGDNLVMESKFKTPHVHTLRLNTNGDLWKKIEKFIL